MTPLIEDLAIAIRMLRQSLGFEASPGRVAAVVPLLLLGVALNFVALSAVNAVHPLKRQKYVVCKAREELRFVQAKVATVMHCERVS